MLLWALCNSSLSSEKRKANQAGDPLFFAHLNNDSTHIVAALRTNGMRWGYSAAL